jgi:nucleotide-binding universal stress UspA family protein
MFNHILIPTDLTERSLKALDVAVSMAVRDGGRITLLHVIETIEDTGSEEFQDFYHQLEKRARKSMEEIIGKYLAHQPFIETEIIYGKRVKEIVRFAEEQEIDLIIVSSHRVERESGLQGWGTISYKVGILSHCPVMLVK